MDVRAICKSEECAELQSPCVCSDFTRLQYSTWNSLYHVLHGALTPENPEVLKYCWLQALPHGMARRAYTGPVVCVEPSVIKGCYSAGRTEVKFVPLTQGIFQEVCLSDRVVRNVPARL